jgi:hypothetical protein
MAVTARIVHRLPGRTRVRIRGAGEDWPHFEAVREALLGLSGVDEVRINPRTGSALILHEGALVEEIEAHLKAFELFEFSDRVEIQIDALEHLRAGARVVNRRLAEITTGRGDLNAIVFIVLIVLALRQILRGQILSPAIALLWYAMEMVVRSGAERER